MSDETNIDKVITYSTTLGVRSIDYDKLIEKAEQNLETLKSLLKFNADDKNVQAVIKLKIEEVSNMYDLKKDWMSMINVHAHKDVRIVILIEQL